MTTLHFKDRGWDVITSSWTVGAKDPKGDTVTLVYTWGADGLGWSGQSVSTAKIELKIGLATFLQYIRLNPVLCNLTHIEAA